MTTTDRRPVVLIVGSGGRLYREYLLASASRDHHVWLLDATPPSWQRRYTVGATVVPLIDRSRLVPDATALLEAATRLTVERPVAGVLSYDETLVTATARIAERLGLPGLTLEGADRCRNKQRTRTALTVAGLPQPGFAVAGSLAEARQAAAAIGYPLVVKPRGMGASIGVVSVGEPDELPAAFATAERASHEGSPDYEGGVLVEQHLDGPEISVDGAVGPDGAYRAFCLARKRTGMPPYFEETGHTVDAADPLLSDGQLVDALAKAHRALALGPGITHTEVKLTRRGPVIVEVNARLGGDLIPYLGRLATGVDPGAVAVTLATGAPPPLEPSARRCVAIRFLYPPHDCEVTAVRLPEDEPGLVAARAMAAPGDELRLPPRAHLGRYAYVICHGDGPGECEARLDAAVDTTRLECRPLG